MAPTLRSQSTKGVKFPIVCTADIDTNILRDILANEELALVTKKDLSELATTDAELDSFQAPFTEDLPEAVESLGVFMDAAKSKDGISHRAFVILDKTTARDKTTCQIATDGREDEASQWTYIAFRCELSSIPHGLAAVEEAAEATKATRDLRSEAAMIGGVWGKERVDEYRARPRRIDVGEYPVHDSWDEYSGPDSSDTDIPYVPVFRTAKISLETVNQFVKETYDQDWGDEEIANPRVAFVTAIDSAPFHSGKVVSPLDSTLEIPEALLGASAAECDAVVRSRFPTEGSELNYNRFIILDELSEKDKTVVIGANNELEGQLLLSRCDFKGALISLLAPEETSLTMDAMCHEAVTEGPGIMHGTPE